MIRILATAIALTFTVAVGHAESVNKDSPGTTGAMQNSNSNGVATDPNGVAAQQGRSTGASPGTVGAAPGADTPSQNPSHTSK